MTHLVLLGGPGYLKVGSTLRRIQKLEPDLLIGSAQGSGWPYNWLVITILKPAKVQGISLLPLFCLGPLLKVVYNDVIMVVV